MTKVILTALKGQPSWLIILIVDFSCLFNIRKSRESSKFTAKTLIKRTLILILIAHQKDRYLFIPNIFLTE